MTRHRTTVIVTYDDWLAQEAFWIFRDTTVHIHNYLSLELINDISSLSSITATDYRIVRHESTV